MDKHKGLTKNMRANSLLSSRVTVTGTPPPHAHQCTHRSTMTANLIYDHVAHECDNGS